MFSDTKVEIARVDPEIVDENIFAETFSVFMKNDYSIAQIDNNLGSDSTELKLMPYDQIYVRPDPYFAMQKMVTISGAVYYPGQYAILRFDETIYDIIQRAGGLRPNAFTIGSFFSRQGTRINLDMKKVMKGRRSKQNLTVNEGDMIEIGVKPDIIQIIGEVNSPGHYKYNRNYRISDFIKDSGGLTRDADKDNIFVSFANGKSKKYRRWLLGNPKVLDGSIVTVGKLPEREPFNLTEYLKEVTAIAASVAQTLSILLIASRS